MSHPRLPVRILAGAAVLALLAGAAGTAAAAWNGSDTIMLGDSRTASFDGATDPGYHEYWFFASQSTSVSLSLKPGKTGDGTYALELWTLDGQKLNLGATQATPVSVKGYLLPSSGWFAARVVLTGGTTGSYTFAAKGKAPKSFTGNDATGSIKFPAGAGSALSASLRAAGAGVVPVITALKTPSGGTLTIPADLAALKGVILPQTGTYTLEWESTGAAGAADYSVGLKAAKSLRKKVALGDARREPLSTLEPGDPDAGVTAAAGYVGSGACATCHDTEHASMLDTMHNGKMRNTFRSGAAGYVIPPAMDALFKANTDLVAAFPEIFRTSGGTPLGGLRLRFDSAAALPYKITIGTTTYDVMYVMGGNGPWKQRYVLKIGNAHYVSPVQYNELYGNLSTYNATNWFDGVTGAPLVTISTSTSWEKGCAGCHATGVSVEYIGGEYRTWYAQMNVGCEACHGPGQAHAAGPSKANIVNPSALVDGSAAGVKNANLVCGQCHHRGTGDTPAGAPSAVNYPWDNAGGIYEPGDPTFDDYYRQTTTASDYWRYKDNPMGFSPTAGDIIDDTWLASKSHHQQYIDLLSGPHAPDKPYDATCFDCHDPHGNGVEAQIRTEVEGVSGTSTDDNSLCLACHKGYGDFAGLAEADVEAITDTSAPAVVVNAVIDHMKDKAAMPVDSGDYDPAGTAVGRCTTCHMPLLGKSAVFTQTDADGHKVGDVHAHTFVPVWPNVSVLENGAVTNSCSACHPTSGTDAAQESIDEWASDGPDNDGVFHASTPRNFQNGVANPERDGGVACVACHTTKGFIDIQVNGSLHDLTGAGDATARTAMLKDAIRHDRGITCQACHGKSPGGTYAAGDNPLRFPKADLCGKCHNNETVLFEDYRDHGEIVRHPQKQMLAGVEGGQVPAQTYGSSLHATILAPNKCVSCHYNENAGGHTFEPEVSDCTGCHGPISTFNFPASKDYDNDGTTEGIQDEVHGLLDVIRTAVLAETPSTADVTITHDGEYFLIGRGGASPVAADETNTDLLDPTNDAALLRAMFNWYWVEFDGSFGVHNHRYAIQLLQKSWEELTGGSWPAGKKP